MLRSTVGAFDRHGLVSGNLTGADASREHAIRTTRRITRHEWWDEVVEGMPIRSRLPIDLDPATTHGPFLAGIDAAGGHLAAVEFTGTPDAKTLSKVGLLIDYQPNEGATLVGDVPLEFEATQSFFVPDAAAALDPLIDAGSLSLALALQLDDDRVLAVTDRCSGNVGVTGSDLQLLLPPLSGRLAGRSWRTIVAGSRTDSAGTYRHSSLIELPNDSSSGFRLPRFPTLTSPQEGSVALASGFDVVFSLPNDALFGAIELRSDDGTELLLWQVIVPPDATSFSFVALPPPSSTPLQPGRTYTLTLSAWFGEVITDSVPPYRDLIAWAQSVPPIEIGARQVARHSITITTN